MRNYYLNDIQASMIMLHNDEKYRKSMNNLSYSYLQLESISL
mgnify:CR=1 FL=1